MRRTPISRRATLRVAVATCLALSGVPSGADDSTAPTFSRDVLPILQRACLECHRTGGANYGGMIAPMAFGDWAETRPWAKAIAAKVRSREMPPWDAAPEFNGVFANERVLALSEIDAIERWAAAGAPQGDPADAPPPREFPSSNGWTIGEPDLVVLMPAPFVVSDEADDIYTQFAVDLTDEQLPADAWITAFQCKPGSSIVHHFNAHILPPDESGRLPPPPDSPVSKTIAPVGAGMYLGGVSSGTDPTAYPEGYAVPLKRGSRVTFDIHYHKEPGPGTGATDLSAIGFRLSHEPPKAAIEGVSILHFGIAIAPGEPEVRLGPFSRKVTRDSTLVGLMPHMHMRGKRARFEALYPDGSRETLLEVPEYDFAWQTVYYYREPKRLPAGTKLEFAAWYDNSPEYGSLRGFDSTKPVRYGQKSTDEMMMGFAMTAPSVSPPHP